MPDLEAYIQLGATFLILMVVLFIIYKVAMKFTKDHIELEKEKNVLERADRTRVDDAMITGIKNIVETVTNSNSKHSNEHTSIMKLLKETEENNTDTHKEMSKQIKKNTDSIDLLHSDIKVFHSKLISNK